MRRFTLFLLVAAHAPAAEPQVARFRLRKDPSATISGWIARYDEDGFAFESLARDRKSTIKWADLVEEDARRLRIERGLELSEEAEKGLIDGHELKLEGGGSVKGLLASIDKDGSHWMRVRGNLLPYPKDRIVSVDAAKIGEDEAYGEEEVYARRLTRRPPRTAEEHRRLADYLYDVGNFDAARQHYDTAIAMEPSLGQELAARLGDSQEYLADLAAAPVFGKAKGDAVLNGKWREAIDAVRAYGDKYPASRRRAEKLAAELEQRWFEAKQDRYHAIKHEEFDRAVRAYVARTQPTLDEAKSWATAELEALVRDRTARRLGLSDDEVNAFVGTKARGTPHWASYWAGTFAISKRAAIGQSTKREIRGDPEAWWRQIGDVNARSSWLKAYAAEALGIFEIMQVTSTPCERCGGTGQVSKTSMQALQGGRHEWQERCPRCYGACNDRGVGYR